MKCESGNGGAGFLIVLKNHARFTLTGLLFEDDKHNGWGNETYG